MKKINKFITIIVIFCIIILIYKFCNKFSTFKEYEIWNRKDRRIEMMRSDSHVKEYLTFKEMINDSSLKNGDICKVLGYEELEDGGISYWKIKNSNDPDNLLSFNIGNGELMAEYILENTIQINVKAIGIKSMKLFLMNILRHLSH